MSLFRVDNHCVTKHNGYILCLSISAVFYGFLKRIRTFIRADFWTDSGSLLFLSVVRELRVAAGSFQVLIAHIAAV